MTTHHRFSTCGTRHPALGGRRPWLTGTAIRLLGALAIVAAAGPLFAQGNAQKSSKIVQDKVLTTDDNFPIHITYFQSSRGKDAPVVILLHGKDGNRLVWRKPSPGFKEGLAGRLHDEGYAVVSVDLRRHGESRPGSDTTVSQKPGDTANVTPDDLGRMVRFDMEEIKDFLFAEHQKGNLNMRKTGIVAVGMSAPVAVNFAAIDWSRKPYDDAPTFAARTPRGQDIRALALISPEENAPGLPAGRVLLELRNPALGIAFLVAYGSKDKLDRGDAKRIHQKLSHPSNKERVYLQTFDYKLRGTDMLGQNIKLEETILGFLKKHLMELPDEWRDRQSRLK